jgi:hypothetical protein
VLSFAVALAAFCVQSTEVHGRILLAVVLGIVGTAGFGTLLFFWHVWKGPRTEEIGQQTDDEVMAYGWRSKARNVAEKTKKAAEKTKRAVKKGVDKIQFREVLKRGKAQGKAAAPAVVVQTA